MAFEDLRALARGLAEAVSARAGESLWLRDHPPCAPGETGRVVLGVARGAVYRVLAVASDLGAHAALTSLVPLDGQPGVSTGALLAGDGREGTRREQADRLSSTLADGLLDRTPLTALDAATTIIVSPVWPSPR